VQSVFEKLITNKILSTPCYDPMAQKYVGFIDLADIVYFLLDNLSEEQIRTGHKAPDALVNTPCKSIKNLSKRNKFSPVQKDASVEALLDLVEPWLHRVPVINETGEVIGVVSQSSIVQYIYTYIHLFDIRHTVGEIQLGYKDVHTIGEDSSVVAGFQMIREAGISGIAVVNNDGKLIGCLSLSDLRILGADFSLLKRVYMTIGEYLNYKDGDKRPQVICVSADSTITEVADIFAKHKIHRIYVVDAEKKPVGVISLGDYLKLFRTSHEVKK